MSLIKKALYALTIVAIALFSLASISKAATVEIITETLNLRKKATTESDIVALISIGEECELLGEEGDWYKVQYGEYTGYISKEYAKTSEEETSTSQDKTTQNEGTIDDKKEEDKSPDETKKPETTKPQEEINDNTSTKKGKLKKTVSLKIVPLISGSEIAKLKNGTSVTIIEELNDWSYVQTDILSGWIRSDVLNIQKNQNANNDNNENNSNSGNNSNTTNNQSNNNSSGNTDNKPDNNKSDNENFQEKTMYAVDYINVRKEPSTSADIIMTVAPNDEFKVIGELEDWYKVETSEGNAYISKELLSNSKIEVTNRGNIDRTGNTEKEENNKKDNSTSKVSEETDKSNNTTSSSSSATSATASKIVNYAKKYLGVPYVYGGASPSGFDCSGFTMYVYEHFGISMRHGAQAQSKLGKKISADKSSKSSLLKNLKVGDLVFFLDYETMDEIGHCGIYIGNGDFIHASSGSGYCVKINSLLPGEYYNTRYCAARRVL